MMQIINLHSETECKLVKNNDISTEVLIYTCLLDSIFSHCICERPLWMFHK